MLNSIRTLADDSVKEVHDSITQLQNVSAGADTMDRMLSAIFVILGSLAVLVIVLAGVRYIISHGDTRVIEESKNQLFYAIIGLVVAISAKAIATFVLS